MKNNLTAINKNTLYVVYDVKTNKVFLETESKTAAFTATQNGANLEYSTYPPMSYAKNKIDVIADLYDTTFQEY